MVTWCSVQRLPVFSSLLTRRMRLQVTVAVESGLQSLLLTSEIALVELVSWLEVGIGFRWWHIKRTSLYRRYPAWTRGVLCCLQPKVVLMQDKARPHVACVFRDYLDDHARCWSLGITAVFIGHESCRASVEYSGAPYSRETSSVRKARVVVCGTSGRVG